MNGIRQEQHDIFAGLSTAIGKQAAKKTRLEPDLKVPVSQSENDIDRQTTGESVNADDQNSSVTVNVAEEERCSVDSASTISSSSLQSSHCSLPSVNPSPMIKRRLLAMEAVPIGVSKSEPTTPAKTACSSTDRNHITIVPCPSPPTGSALVPNGISLKIPYLFIFHCFCIFCNCYIRTLKNLLHS
ncbi:unnamed protein product [Enterobius vermicularis]|uniref:Uncharacterized protein n=1 Tax=Enterobius vermicularis TaxID=51028 RepID=A0A0N4VRC6_ENTVE|nr:unnamed protein product [Enterobius vermicularis]